jgi:hypothetical protein
MKGIARQPRDGKTCPLVLGKLVTVAYLNLPLLPPAPLPALYVLQNPCQDWIEAEKEVGNSARSTCRGVEGISQGIWADSRVGTRLLAPFFLA